MPERIHIDVAYALPTQQTIISLEVAPGTTALQAAHGSGIADRFPDINPDQCVLGIFGETVSHDHILQSGDRVEIYRPLVIDPKESRRQRAAQLRTRKTGA